MAKEGKRQSPIDIETENVVESMAVTTENPLSWEYTEKHCLNLENTGSSWKVNVDGTGSSKLKEYINIHGSEGNRELESKQMCENLG